MKSLQILCTIPTLAAILFIDYGYAGPLAFSGILTGATSLELFIFAMQLCKTCAFLALKELRKAGPAVLIDLTGADLIALPILAAAYLILGTPGIPGAAAQLIRAWFAGSALSVLIYSAYRIGDWMLHSGKLITILPSTIVTAELGIVFANAADSAALAHTGLAGVASATIAGNVIGLASGPGIFASLGMIYISLLAYSVLGWAAGSEINPNKALVIAVLATSATAGWVIALSSYSPVAALVLLPPALVIGTISWWVGRAA